MAGLLASAAAAVALGAESTSGRQANNAAKKRGQNDLYILRHYHYHYCPHALPPPHFPYPSLSLSSPILPSPYPLLLGSMGAILGVLSGSGIDNKRPPSASPGPFQGTTTTTAAAAATTASPFHAAKNGTGGGVDVELPEEDKMHQALIRIFCTLLREQPAVVILEDAHDIDEQSWKVGFVSIPL